MWGEGKREGEYEDWQKRERTSEGGIERKRRKEKAVGDSYEIESTDHFYSTQNFMSKFT